MTRKFVLTLREMRVKQWTKNLLVYSAPLFNGSLFTPSKLITSSAVFISFCLASSGIYIINDIIDRDKDRLNPEKCSRPLASGELSAACALAFSVMLAVSSLALSFFISREYFCILSSYLVLNVLYSLKLKNIVIIDVMSVAYGFVARAAAGAVACGVEMTAWFILCVMFLSLFLALGKRRYELAGEKFREGREVLKDYSLDLIDRMMNITTSAVIMSYALFTMDSATKNSRAMSLTIPLVLYGIFYYLYVVHVKNGGGSPDESLYREKPILITVTVYVLYVIAVRNF